MNKNPRIFFGLGSSIGDADEIFESAGKFLEKSGLKIQKKSSILKNDPIGGVAENQFSNAVWEVRWNEEISAENYQTEARKILSVCKKCEKIHGRNFRAPRWSDRTLDIDILAIGDFQIKTEKLTIPHPEVKNRDFVMIPWREIVDENFTFPCE